MGLGNIIVAILCTALTVGTITMMALSILESVGAFEDKEKAKLAKEGRIALVTLEQLLLLNSIEPERYKLDDARIFGVTKKSIHNK